jgi:protein-disulfide isomerase
MSAQKDAKLWKASLDMAATVATVLAAVSVVWLSQAGALATRPVPRSEPLPSAPLDLTGVAVKGNSQAKVAMIEFADFECPFCRTFANDTLPSLVTRYVSTGKVLFGFRHFPLTDIHSLALRAGSVAECGRLQGNFWAVHDSLFAHPLDDVDREAQSTIDRLNLDRPAFDSCLGGLGERNVLADQKLGRQLGIAGTPSFFVGAVTADGKVRVKSRISGAKSTAAFTAILDELLKAQRE